MADSSSWQRYIHVTCSLLLQGLLLLMLRRLLGGGLWRGAALHALREHVQTWRQM